MSRILFLLSVAIFLLLSFEISAHRIILKSGEEISGNVTDNDPALEEITIQTGDGERKIKKSEISEMRFEEAGNILCLELDEDPKRTCTHKLTRINAQTLFYVTEAGEYLRVAIERVKYAKITEPSPRILQQLSKTNLKFTVSSETEDDILSKISILNDESIMLTRGETEAPTILENKNISKIVYKLEDLTPKNPETGLVLWDYLIPGYYLARKEHTKSGYALMGVTGLFALGAAYEYYSGINVKEKQPMFLPQDNGTFLLFDQDNSEYSRHKQLNHLFLISLSLSYIFNTALISFPAVFSIAATERNIPYASAVRERNIEFKMTYNF
ncbi:hypothetical protein DLM76_03215 [Leptospira yasudae]|uniref:DUF5683 domain-containing protein n=1 Tax=Leptospira yasudae TaxID=2202201 RepID=A0ABX9M6E0_9LEPT|nr:hypothetical protein [Leptospira yasudae]RHX81475.1 hypothetical protein DLM77_05125 [Leptospira yasudae]RHX95986.1 hypothetical protein DLM76_03215 [Leptospira yasudae]TGK29798.1 hypothetical protein EHQ05_02200 [Leptospira yasudae]TGM07577.1 hypothetical protein EHQ86_05815 [Leptospira yasudae]